MEKEPKIGLALGSGGARGFAHLGVLKILKDSQIPVSMIAGSSMGALIGGIYASGIELDRMYKLAEAFKRKYYLDFTIPKMGFIAGKRVEELIKVFTMGKNIEDLAIPLAIVATDLYEGKKVVFKTGAVSKAVRASIAIPGIFVPVKADGRLLVDGGVIDRVPVSVVKEMGADLVIGVDVSRVKQHEDIQSIFDVIMQSLDIMQEELLHHRETVSDLMMKPSVEQYSSRAFTSIQEIIGIGEQEALKHLPKIKLLISQWKEQQTLE
nr:patatin-like phospholipase family protein [Metabacillus kandeliae]